MSDNKEGPLDRGRIAGYVNEVARGSQTLAAELANDINEISIRRAMHIGYMLACQDHGLPVPHMPDPAKDYPFGER